MPSATFLLFEKLYGGKPLFSTQSQLVTELLEHPSSSYFQPVKGEDYRSAQNRLKAYISQLMSGAVIRKVNATFKHSLTIVVTTRLSGTEHIAVQVTDEIINALERSNQREVAESRRSFQSTAMRSFFHEVLLADDILIITARPFDVIFEEQISLQNVLVQELFQSLLHAERSLKRYRFNFPMRQTAELFWYGLRKAVDIQAHLVLQAGTHIDNFFRSSLIHRNIYDEILAGGDHSKDLVSRISTELIRYFNVSGQIMVYVTDEPIYSIPMVILHPNKGNTAPYMIHENDEGVVSVTKLSKIDTYTWKYMVWDRMKTRGLGNPLYFDESQWF